MKQPTSRTGISTLNTVKQQNMTHTAAGLNEASIACDQGQPPLEEWPAFPTQQVRPALHRSLWMSLRDLSTLTVRCAVAAYLAPLLQAAASRQRYSVFLAILFCEATVRKEHGQPCLGGRPLDVFLSAYCRRLYEKLAALRCTPQTTTKLLKGGWLPSQCSSPGIAIR